jgi:Lysine methyltransferase
MVSRWFGGRSSIGTERHCLGTGKQEDGGAVRQNWLVSMLFKSTILSPPLCLSCFILTTPLPAMPEMTRTWLVPGPITTSPLTFSIREPPLTGDNLGLKTWGTAFTMAKKLDYLGTKYLSHLFNENAACMNPQKQMQVLELGSGTGLVGIAAAAIWRVPVLLTDLPEIQANLSHNVLQNTQVIETHGGQTDSAILDWKDPDALATRDFEVGPLSIFKT